MSDLDLHYRDPRLVALYDIDNPRGSDTDFYLRLAEELEAGTVVDLGCGTGLLTCELAIDGRRTVIGLDPAPGMLAVARARPGSERVTWVEGDANALGTAEADLVLMTGNVAQVFLHDSSWAETLAAIYVALRPGGHLAFDSRNPSARAWEHWNRKETFERIDSPFGPMECWLELLEGNDDRVLFEGHNVFLETGEVLVALSELRFRSVSELTESLVIAGLTVENVYGGWDGEPFGDTRPTIVVVARR